MIINRRLHFQSLAKPRFDRPEDVVEWLGAVQAQDFPAAKWAVAQRLTGRGADASDRGLDQAFNAGTIVRTHVLRPTWHFVPARDLRWMLALTAPRIRAALVSQARWLGLDAATVTRAERTIVETLSGGRQMTRQELGDVVPHRTMALGHVIIQAEVDGLICSGALKGKHHTYALLDERIPTSRTMERDAALALLAWRYFRSHGPATLKDFVWWSGLSTTDAKQGISNARGLVSETIGGTTYWLSDKAVGRARTGRLHLLPNFDEFLVAYADRTASYDGSDRNLALTNTVVLDGRVVGTWKRTFIGPAVRLQVKLFARVSKAKLHAAVQRFGTFLGRTASFHV
jgi:Winged helix DNA-binding domain